MFYPELEAIFFQAISKILQMNQSKINQTKIQCNKKNILKEKKI